LGEGQVGRNLLSRFSIGPYGVHIKSRQKMAQPVMNALAGRLVMMAVCLGALIGQPAFAQGLVDPTRPAGASQSATAGGAQASLASPELQYVSISPQSKSAVISGKVVFVGEKYGESRVVKISEDEVVLLASGGKQQVLKLYPGVEKQAAGAANSSRARPQ
jgi:hypothetical protein